MISDDQLSAGGRLCSRTRSGPPKSVGEIQAQPLEPEVQAKQIREADAAMNLGRGAGHETAHFGQMGLGVSGSQEDLRAGTASNA